VNVRWICLATGQPQENGGDQPIAIINNKSLTNNLVAAAMSRLQAATFPPGIASVNPGNWHRGLQKATELLLWRRVSHETYD
jgi:hypothetical protein